MTWWAWVIIGVLVLIIIWLVLGIIAFGSLAGELLNGLTRGMSKTSKPKKRKWL
jgi:hypothetical protein